MKMFTAFLADEAGFILSAEMVLVATVAVLGLSVMLVTVRDSVGAELTDLSNAFRQLDQSYAFGGVRGGQKQCGISAFTSGSKFLDTELREPGSERDIFVEDLELGCHRQVAAVQTFTPCPVHRLPAPCGAEPCQASACPCPNAGCQTPGCEECQRSTLPVIPEEGVPYLPAPPSPVRPVPCDDCPPFSAYGNVRPTPSSDIPPGRYSSPNLYFPWAPPYSAPIPKMPAGPLQVW